MFNLMPLFPQKFSNFFFLFPLLQIMYSPVCHQELQKLICNEIGCTFLCARCTGIYAGVFIFSLILLLKTNVPVYKIKYLFIAGIPIIADVIASSIGIYSYSRLTAFITGTIFGSAAFYYFYIGIQNWFFEKGRQPQ